MNAIQRLRIIAWLEGISFLVLLFIAMPMKYIGGDLTLMRPTGMAHGVLFVAYVVFVLEVKMAMNWSGKKTVIALAASILPFGTFFINNKWIHRP
ncbi:DUF3817 domain-containing protein [Chitinophaga lutea]